MAMMPEEWPIAAPAADQNASARPARRDRLAAVRVDFFLNPADRLSEQERALMTAMLHCLVGDISDEIRSTLPSGWSAANDEGHLSLVDILSAAGVLDRPPLVRLLLRRADEERIATGTKARSGRREARVLQGLVSHEDGAVAAAAMALILARGRRRDRFGQCLLHFDDLPREEAIALVHLVCAAIRRDLAAVLGSAEADRLLSDASERVLASHDPGSALEALNAKLARLLDEEGDLTDELIAAGAMEGEMTFVSQALTRRGGFRGNVALDELLSGDDTRLMLLLRAAGVRREFAASILAGIGDLLGITDAGAAIDAFDSLNEGQVAATRSWLASEPGYRNAVLALGNPNG
jgi:hypothetical protein